MRRQAWHRYGKSSHSEWFLIERAIFVLEFYRSSIFIVFYLEVRSDARRVTSFLHSEGQTRINITFIKAYTFKLNLAYITNQRPLLCRSILQAHWLSYFVLFHSFPPPPPPPPADATKKPWTFKHVCIDRRVKNFLLHVPLVAWLRIVVFLLGCYRKTKHCCLALVFIPFFPLKPDFPFSVYKFKEILREKYLTHI